MVWPIMSHVHGTTQPHLAPLGHKVNHFGIVRPLAERDPGTYGQGQDSGRGWEFYRQLALTTPDDQPYPLD